MDDYIVIFLIVLLGFAVYFYKDKIFPNQYEQSIINKNININKNVNKNKKNQKNMNNKNHKQKKKVSFENIELTENTESTFNVSHDKSNISDLSPPNYDSFENESYAEFKNEDEFSNGSFRSLNSSMSNGSHSTLDSKLSILE
jgi:hypothetical protein